MLFLLVFVSNAAFFLRLAFALAGDLRVSLRARCRRFYLCCCLCCDRRLQRAESAAFKQAELDLKKVQDINEAIASRLMFT